MDGCGGVKLALIGADGRGRISDLRSGFRKRGGEGGRRGRGVGCGARERSMMRGSWAAATAAVWAAVVSGVVGARAFGQATTRAEAEGGAGLVREVVRA